MTNRTCSFPECDSPHHAKGYCSTHRHQQAEGRPMVAVFRGDTEQRFWAKVTKSEGCWEWTGARSSGHGRLKVNGKAYGAHKFSWELVNGPTPEGMFIDHICHNRGCVNPGHLRPVTPKQNVENRSGVYRNNKSGVHGVRWLESKQRYEGQVVHEGRTVLKRVYRTLEEAESAVLAKRLEVFTHNDVDRVKA